MQHQAPSEECVRDRHGQCCALFGIGRGAQLIEQHQGIRCGFARDAVEVDHVGGEAREVALDGLRVADVGVNAGEERQRRLFRGNRHASLRHNGQQAKGLEGDGLAAGVGPADDELLAVGWKDDGERDRGFGYCVGLRPLLRASGVRAVDDGRR